MSKSKDGRYETVLLCDNPLAIAMDGEVTEAHHPYPLYDHQTWGKKEFWRRRDIKGAWLYDRIIGSRKTGWGSREGVPLYDRSKLNIDNMRDKLVDGCSACNSILNYGRGFNKTYYDVRGITSRPSLDRIDSDRGYEPENVQILCFECNTEKG